jgi:NodT family efflux transporter outer membrane factor (OMF) lipoprotein
MKLVIFLSLLLVSCKVGQDYKKPEIIIAKDWLTNLKTTDENTQVDLTNWWENFNDPVLTQLIQLSYLQNFDIQIASQNIEKVRAESRIIDAKRYPELSANGSASRSKTSSRLGNNFTAGSIRNQFDVTFDASWELDLWGRVRREQEAALARYEASVENSRDVYLTVFAEVARNYINLRGAQERLKQATQKLALFDEALKIVQDQFKLGSVDKLAVTRAKAERSTAASATPNIKAEIYTIIYRLAVLCGKQPTEMNALLLKKNIQITAQDIVLTGLPSDLMRRRPDIRKIERELAAYTADVAVSKGAFFPSFSLTGSAGNASSNFSNIYSSNSNGWSLGSVINFPLFNAGKLKAQNKAAKAQQKAAIANYHKTILLALEDVEASLIRYAKEAKTLAKLRERETSNNQAFNIMQTRYKLGEVDKLSLLNEKQNLIASHQQSINSETQMLTNIVALYKALGGGW